MKKRAFLAGKGLDVHRLVGSIRDSNLSLPQCFALGQRLEVDCFNAFRQSLQVLVGIRSPLSG